MDIRLELFGTYRNLVSEYDPGKGILIDIERDMPLPELMRRIGIAAKGCLVMINGTHVKVEDTVIVKGNDLVQIFMLVGGG